MNEIKFSCPSCKQSLEAPPEMAGQLTDCPTCNEAIEIPFPSQQNAEVPSPVLPPPKISSPVAQSNASPSQDRPPKRHGVFHYVFWGTVSLAATLAILIVGFFFLSAFGAGIFSAWKKHPDGQSTVTRQEAAAPAVQNLPPLTEAEKVEAQKLVDTLEEKKDEIEGIRWYTPGAAGGYRTSVYFYMGKKNAGEPWLRWKIRYYGDKWLFIRRYRVKVDDAEAVTVSPTAEIKHETGSGSVWEVFDEAALDHANVLNQMLASQKILIRMEGTEGVEDIELTPEMLKQLHDVLLVYRSMGGKWPK
jgi:hypothetical protein